MDFCKVKDALSQGKRCSFEVLKVPFCTVKEHLLEGLL